MDVKSEVIEIIDELFMEDVSDMMDEDLFDAGVLDSMGTVELIVELESRFDIRKSVSEFVVMTGTQLIRLPKVMEFRTLGSDGKFLAPCALSW